MKTLIGLAFVLLLLSCVPKESADREIKRYPTGSIEYFPDFLIYSEDSLKVTVLNDSMDKVFKEMVATYNLVLDQFVVSEKSDGRLQSIVKNDYEFVEKAAYDSIVSKTIQEDLSQSSTPNTIAKIMVCVHFTPAGILRSKNLAVIAKSNVKLDKKTILRLYHELMEYTRSLNSKSYRGVQIFEIDVQS
jgi:hypothetical protein